MFDSHVGLEFTIEILVNHINMRNLALTPVLEAANNVFVNLWAGSHEHDLTTLGGAAWWTPVSLGLKNLSMSADGSQTNYRFFWSIQYLEMIGRFNTEACHTLVNTQIDTGLLFIFLFCLALLITRTKT